MRYDTARMKTPTSFSASIFGLSIILVLVTSIGIRLGLPRVSSTPPQNIAGEPAQNALQPTEEASTSTIPDLTSAAFPDGDALKGLGADWTFVRQEDVSNKASNGLSGTRVMRESVISAVGKTTQLLLTESDIIDRKMLDAAVKAKDVKKVIISGRDGYLVPSLDKNGGTGFLLVGTNTTLLIQDSASASWPKALDAAVLTYIATVHIP